MWRHKSTKVLVDIGINHYNQPWDRRDVAAPASLVERLGEGTVHLKLDRPGVRAQRLSAPTQRLRGKSHAAAIGGKGTP